MQQFRNNPPRPAKIKMFQTIAMLVDVISVLFLIFGNLIFGNLILEFVSDFGIRISNFVKHPVNHASLARPCGTLIFAS